MKSIFEEINCLKLEDWNYYQKNTNKNNPFTNYNHKEFIEQYLKDGEKEFIYTFFEKYLNKFNRFEHTNSIFFIGCLLYKKLSIKEDLSLYPKKYVQIKHNQFHFIWFLTSLIHDFAYDIEKNFSCYKVKYSSIEKIEEKLDNKLLKQNILLNQKANKLITNIGKYFKYRFEQSQKIDHGIIGGIILYDTLVNNRKQRKENQENGIENSGLYWDDDLDELYAKICFSIATHNIWSPNSLEIKELYKKYNLNDLVDGDIFPISIKDNPFLFLLGLVDTIDPVKLYQPDNSDANYILNNILIQLKNNTIYMENKNGSKLDFSKIKSKVYSVNGWLDVTLCFENSRIKIDIN